MKVEIDRRSGFCFGVINAIKEAENELERSKQLYSLGDIVHNGKEVERLEKMGLKSITTDEFFKLKDCKVLIRAHGEPPATYEHARKNNIELIDATCPVVITLQEKVKGSYLNSANHNGQVVIFGKKGHAEIIGLNGQTNDNAIVLESLDDVKKVDPTKPVALYSQTTKRIEDFHDIAKSIKEKMNPGVPVQIKDTICRQVSNRVPNLQKFATQFDMVLFIAGEKSSNGRYLYTVCKEVNPKSYKVSGIEQIEEAWFDGIESVGICGATSTPQWLMEDAAKWIHNKFD
jgi:4-hydroxy-3-methylbut-2-enyl diphosphate reductase